MRRLKCGSHTASIVAALRGAGRGSSDSIARRVVAWPWSRLLALAEHVPASTIGTVTLGASEHLARRTCAIDSAIADTVGSPSSLRQLVILGAGMDTRAWRMSSLRSVDVIEIDRPHTQEAKRRRVQTLRAFARSVQLVGCNLEHDELDAALSAAKHDERQPTVWVCEGVTNYLRPQVTTKLLALLSRRSAKGSRVAVTYVVRDVSTVGRVLGAVSRTGFLLLGEAQYGLSSNGDMTRTLERAGFRVVHDIAISDLACGAEDPWKPALRYANERLALAVIE